MVIYCSSNFLSTPCFPFGCIAGRVIFVKKTLKKLSKLSKKMPKSCQKVVKGSLKKAKIGNFDVEDETCGRRRRRRKKKLKKKKINGKS
jgi:hypothetical protein